MVDLRALGTEESVVTEEKMRERERERNNITTVYYPEVCGVFILRLGRPLQ